MPIGTSKTQALICEKHAHRLEEDKITSSLFDISLSIMAQDARKPEAEKFSKTVTGLE